MQDPSTQRKGFEKVVEQYSEQLYWQIRRMVLSHEDANDLLQNTFLKAWANIEYFRAEAASSTVSLDSPEADALLQKLESDPYFSGDEMQKKLQKALIALPEKQRMVFNLRYYQEMKYDEMSAIFGTSVGALKASYYHAVKKIEQYLSVEY